MLAIWAGDPYVPAAFAERQRDYFPRSEVVVLPGGGHWLMEDNFAAVADVVPFLRQQKSAAAPSGAVG